MFVADTSLLISIEVAELLSLFLKYYDIVIPQQVLKELENMSRYLDEEGKAAKRIVNMANDKVDVKEVGDSSISEEVKHIGEGEAAALHLSKKLEIPILCDDIDALPYISENVEEVYNTPLVVYFLYLRKEISKKEAKKAMKKIIKIRGWEGSILKKVAEKYLGKLDD